MRRYAPPCCKAVSRPPVFILEAIPMHEEQELLALGYPLEDSITLCNSMRRTGELPNFMDATRVNPNTSARNKKYSFLDFENYSR